MDDITPEQIARAAGLGPEQMPKYWLKKSADIGVKHEQLFPIPAGIPPSPTVHIVHVCEYIGPDYPNDPGACAIDLLPVLEQRAEHKLDISKASSWGVWIDGWLPDNKEWPTWHEAICQAVVATQPKEELT